LAESASKSYYREVEYAFRKWTAGDIRHSTVTEIEGE